MRKQKANKRSTWQPTTEREFAEDMMKFVHRRGVKGESVVYTLFNTMRVRMTYNASNGVYYVEDDATNALIREGRRGDIVNWYLARAKQYHGETE